MQRLQIRPIVHNLGAPPTIPPSYVWVQTDRHTDAIITSDKCHIKCCVGMQQGTDRHTDKHLELCCHSNKIRALIANPHNSAQLQDTPTTPPSYIRLSSPKLHQDICAVVWKCGAVQNVCLTTFFVCLTVFIKICYSNVKTITSL